MVENTEIRKTAENGTSQNDVQMEKRPEKVAGYWKHGVYLNENEEVEKEKSPNTLNKETERQRKEKLVQEVVKNVVRKRNDTGNVPQLVGSGTIVANRNRTQDSNWNIQKSLTENEDSRKRAKIETLPHAMKSDKDKVSISIEHL